MQRYNKEFADLIQKWLKENSHSEWSFESFDDGYAILRYRAGMRCISIYNGFVQEDVFNFKKEKLHASDPQFFEKLAAMMQWFHEHFIRLRKLESELRQDELKFLRSESEVLNNMLKDSHERAV